MSGMVGIRSGTFALLRNRFNRFTPQRLELAAAMRGLEGPARHLSAWCPVLMLPAWMETRVVDQRNPECKRHGNDDRHHDDGYMRTCHETVTP
jgi:hypothetical protein